MRDLASRAGITTPTLYAYFDSKNGVFDEMFANSAQQFATHMSAPYDTDESRQLLRAMAGRFVDFCLSDVDRYQLLFQRTIPGFEPSARSYAYAVTALEISRRELADVGVRKDWQIDLLTALLTGLVNQQISNDPGGDRWTCLVDDAVEMFLTHCERTPRPAKSKSKSRSEV
jgi:AcrR family transcriptional regulator